MCFIWIIILYIPVDGSKYGCSFRVTNMSESLSICSAETCPPLQMFIEWLYPWGMRKRTSCSVSHELYSWKLPTHNNRNGQAAFLFLIWAGWTGLQSSQLHHVQNDFIQAPFLHSFIFLLLLYNFAAQQTCFTNDLKE